MRTHTRRLQQSRSDHLPVSLQLKQKPVSRPGPEHPLLHLQRTMGNQAVQHYLQGQSGGANALSGLQPKLQAGSPSDRYEQAADRTAEQVMRSIEPQAARSAGAGKSGHLSGRQFGPAGGSVPDRVTDQAMQRAPNEGALSPGERALFEPRLGRDFSRVRIHADTRSARMADTLNAEAFTVDRDIYFGSDVRQQAPEKSQHLLAHELTHVAQQSGTGPALQPKLKITGKAGDLSRALTLLNSGLFGYSVSIDKSGNVTIAANKDVGPPSEQQSALANRLQSVINDPKDVIMSVSAGTKTLVGSYATGDVDISDIEKIGVSSLIHEVEEQYQKQVKGLAYGKAHKKGIEAESEVKGAKRGPQKIVSSTANPDGTLDAVVEIPYTYPDGKVKTMVMTIKKNNVTAVKWK